LNPELYIGLMSGTSIDAIDSAIVEISAKQTRLLHCREHSIPTHIREQVADISHSGEAEIERMGRLDRALGELFADASLALLGDAGISPDSILAIGSHGQTIRHRPASSGETRHPFTLQIGDPNTIAELTGITTVADFRRRDIAAGGEGAPLAPAFHASAFARAGCNRAIVNIGGIANASLLRGDTLVAGFDTGPGNTLLDHWIQRHQGQPYDRDGEWAAAGKLAPDLLQDLAAHPFMSLQGPRSTGKEAFNLAWLDTVLERHPGLAARDVQATLCQFTADSISTGLEGCGLEVEEVYLCGGGAHNQDLLGRLARALPGKSHLASTEELGIHPDWVEAATFAWLAQRTLAGLPGNAAAVTGAAGARVLGAVYPGG
jgi:anhydro-N-acetylmuramic acid kinase